MATADDLMTGKASVDDLLGIGSKEQPDLRMSGPVTQVESGDMLAAPMEGGPGTTPAGLAGAAIRGMGPTAGSALVGAGLALATGGAVLPAAAIMSAAPVLGDLGVGMINGLFKTHYSNPTDSFQHLFNAIGVPDARSAAEKVVQSATRAGAESLATSGAAAVLAPTMQAGTTARNVVQTMSELPMEQAVASTTGGAAAEMANQAGLPVPLQFAAGVGGALIGGGMSGLQKVGREGLKEAVANAERQGMTPMTSDVLPPTGMFGKFRQRTFESIPLTGTAGKLTPQQETKVEAALNTLREFGANIDVSSLDKVTTDLLAKRSLDLEKFKKLQKEAMNNAALSGAPTVPTPKTDVALKNALKFLSTDSTLAEAIPEFLKIQKDLKGFKNLDNVEIVRQNLSSKFEGPEAGKYREAAQKLIDGLYPPLKADLEAFITKHGKPNDIAKFRVANKRLYTMSRELELKSLKTALQNGKIKPDAAGKMLFSQTRSDVQALYNGLTAEGRAAARATIMERAWENMTKNNAKPNPDRFAKELKKMGNQVGVFFKGDDLARAKGFVEAIELLQRAGQFAISPPTGVVGQIPMVGGSLATIFTALTHGSEGALGVASAILGTGAIGQIYESRIVRDLLLKIPTYKQDSAKKLDAAQKLMTAMRSYGATSESAPQEEQQ